MSGQIGYRDTITDGLVLCIDIGNNKSYNSTSNTCRDISPYNRLCTLNNSPIYLSDNVGSLVFDGVNAKSVTFTPTSLPSGNQSFSISLWAKLNSIPTGGDNRKFIFSYGNGSYGQCVSIGINGSSYFIGSFGLDKTITGTTVQTKKWFNLVITKDATNLKAYLNGVEIYSTDTPTYNIVLSSGLIGGGLEGLLPWNGNISIAKVYNTTLSAADILKDYTIIVKRYLHTPPPGSIIKTNLKFYVDAGDITSYPGTGTTWYDISGSGTNATLYNGPTYNSFGEGSILFDGVDDWGSFDGTNLPYGNSARTISTWIYCTDLTYFNWVFSYGNYTNNQFLSLGNNWASYCFGTGYDVLANGFSTNKWINLVGTYNGTAAKLYANGTLLTSTNRTWNTVQNYVEIGRGFTQDNFPGYISSIAIYNVELTDTQILNNYNVLKDRFGIYL